jgi:glycosyltransferase involved in cell wall biosynthesis
MLCSILIPSRGRPWRLIECINSIKACSTGEVEILIAADEDDVETLAVAVAERKLSPNLHVFALEHGNGWLDNHLRFTHLAEQAKGAWAWMFNDDCTLTGDWCAALQEIPMEGFIVHPEYHQLNQSVYQHDATSGFPCVPNRCWERFGFKTQLHPTDKFLNDVCRDRGWKTAFLKGVTVRHQRNVEEERS